MDFNFEIDHFIFERVLNEGEFNVASSNLELESTTTDPVNQTVALLGTFRPPSPNPGNLDGQGLTAIIRIERTALPSFSDGLTVISTVKPVGSTDIYSWMFGWLKPSQDRPDVKINVICPATDVHIRKYSRQRVHIVRETPALYERIVKPYIDAFPSSRTQWIDEIISGRSEAEKILYRSPPEADPFGFLIVPDMKWDLTNLTSLYLVALMLFPSIKSLRDLNHSHLPLLHSIRREAVNVLRLFVHYQPSYYHFHVHIVNANHTGLLGMTTGQAHMLDDIISLLELDEPTLPSIFQRMTISYGLGEQHGLFTAMKAAQAKEQREGEDGS
ncbi:scavenger mRNA decapping enzyme [Multifurca ochricompacta]|uniref:Scavenger mRNA decapping enzyme n=1 Tax=Multifurca ochricompacta TaxID=376703 RepID=A0AAD4M9M8_9AGAM|nr:scavenger mRNA decapping enzyme [Multifurca ochricompacta]